MHLHNLLGSFLEWGGWPYNSAPAILILFQYVTTSYDRFSATTTAIRDRVACAPTSVVQPIIFGSIAVSVRIPIIWIPPFTYDCHSRHNRIISVPRLLSRLLDTIEAAKYYVSSHPFSTITRDANSFSARHLVVHHGGVGLGWVSPGRRPSGIVPCPR